MDNEKRFKQIEEEIKKTQSIINRNLEYLGKLLLEMDELVKAENEKQD